jgi:hypothetical protein
MRVAWGSSTFDRRQNSQSYGLDLIRRHEDGEELEPDEMQAMRASMYLLTQYVNPPREWADFKWRGPDHFMREIWPKVKDRPEVLHGFFGPGTKAP